MTLIWPSRPFQGLRKNPSKVRYAEGHPGAAVDSLQLWLSQQLDSLDLDQLMASGAVGANATQSAAAREALKQALERGNQEIAARLTLAPHTLWGDLMASLVREWQMSLGATETLRRFALGRARWRRVRGKTDWLLRAGVPHGNCNTTNGGMCLKRPAGRGVLGSQWAMWTACARRPAGRWMNCMWPCGWAKAKLGADGPTRGGICVGRTSVTWQASVENLTKPAATC